VLNLVDPIFDRDGKNPQRLRSCNPIHHEPVTGLSAADGFLEPRIKDGIGRRGGRDGRRQITGRPQPLTQSTNPRPNITRSERGPRWNVRPTTHPGNFPQLQESRPKAH
jgi:hypothetical protein